MDIRVDSLSVVVPAYNEAAGIAETILELRRELPSIASDWEVRLVDDGSTDGTVAAAERAAAGDARVIVQREPHRGKGAAVRAGMLAARMRLRFMCDADLSMSLAQLSRFTAIVPRDCDIAIASREAPGARRVGEPLRRHLMGRAFNWLVRLTTLPGIHDTQCGFKMFSAEAAEAVFPLVRAAGWAFDVEVLALARLLGFRVREVPIEWRHGAVSRISPARDAVGMTRELLSIRRRTRRRGAGRVRTSSSPR